MLEEEVRVVAALVAMLAYRETFRLHTLVTPTLCSKISRITILSSLLAKQPSSRSKLEVDQA